MVTKGTLVIVGAGPGISSSVAIKFATEGYQVALVARRVEKLAGLEDQVKSLGVKVLSVSCDASDESKVKEAFALIKEKLGAPDVLVYNAAARRFKKLGITEVSSEEFVNFWKINCLGAFFCSREVVPDMLQKGKGTIIFTGATAATRALAGLSSFSVGKFGLRALAQSMSCELAPKGLHVVHMIVDGAVDVPIVKHNAKKAFGDNIPDDFFMSPDAIAEQYWNVHMQHRSAWTLEMDLRPFRDPAFVAATPKL